MGGVPVGLVGRDRGSTAVSEVPQDVITVSGQFWVLFISMLCVFGLNLWGIEKPLLQNNKIPA